MKHRGVGGGTWFLRDRSSTWVNWLWSQGSETTTPSKPAIEGASCCGFPQKESGGGGGGGGVTMGGCWTWKAKWNARWVQVRLRWGMERESGALGTRQLRPQLQRVKEQQSFVTEKGEVYFRV